MTTKDTEIRAADIAKELKVSPRVARVKLRAAGFRAPYAAKDLPKMRAVIKAPLKEAATAKPAKSSKSKAAPAPVSA